MGSSRIRTRLATLGLAALACTLAPGGPALADSGDFSVAAGAASLYVVPQASCNTLQAALGSQQSPFELILACSIGGRPATSGPNASPCDLVGGGVNAGLTIGQCLTDTFPKAALPIPPTEPVLEAGKGLKALATGLNLALSDTNAAPGIADFDQISMTSVGAGGGTLLGLIDVQAGSCSTPGGCPTSCGGIPVVDGSMPNTAGETACGTVLASLASSTLPNPPPLSHALFLDVDQTATPGMTKVAVCSGYKWSCRAPGTKPAAPVTYKGQLAFTVVNTPAYACFKRSGCICIAPRC